MTVTPLFDIGEHVVFAGLFPTKTDIHEVVSIEIEILNDREVVITYTIALLDINDQVVALSEQEVHESWITPADPDTWVNPREVAA